MPQQSQPVSANRETIVSARGEDVSKWRKYAVTYYARSIIPYKNEEERETRQRNRETYEHYRDLLLACCFQLEEKEKLYITEPPQNTTP